MSKPETLLVGQVWYVAVLVSGSLLRQSQTYRFSDETFYELEREDAFSRWLILIPIGVISALAPALRLRPKAEPHEREVLRHLLPGMRVIPAHGIRRLPDDGAVWLWNSQPEGYSVSIGSEVDNELLASIPDGLPLRLLRIERDWWTRELSPDIQTVDNFEVDSSIDLWSQDRYSDLSVPAPQGTRHPGDEAETGDSASAVRRFRVVLCQLLRSWWSNMPWHVLKCWFFTTPFRRDVMERSVRQSLAIGPFH